MVVGGGGGATFRRLQLIVQETVGTWDRALAAWWRDRGCSRHTCPASSCQWGGEDNGVYVDCHGLWSVAGVHVDVLLQEPVRQLPAACDCLEEGAAGREEEEGWEAAWLDGVPGGEEG